MGAPSRHAVIAGKYELVEEIGRGGMGSVWRAQALALDVPCAIKFLLPELARDPVARVRFVHEARSAARLRSAHAVTIFDVDSWDGLPYIAMEFLSGRNLEQCLKAEGALSPALTCEIARQVGLGLGKAHALGLVHRDLKPENIFLIDDDALLVKILDFGVVKALDRPLELKTVTGTIVGTPHYMSPEQASGADVDGRSDLWSLAVVIYRCLTGRLPFDGVSLPAVLLNVLYEPIPLPSDHNPGLPRAVDAWFARAVSRDPALRFQTATEFVRELEKACGILPRYSTPAAIEYSASAPARPRLSRASSAGAGLIVRELWAAGWHRVSLIALLTAATLLGAAYVISAQHQALDRASLAAQEPEDAAIPGFPSPDTSAEREPAVRIALNLPAKGAKAREPGAHGAERSAKSTSTAETQLPGRLRQADDERWGF